MSITVRLLFCALLALAIPAQAVDVPTSRFDIKGAKLGDSIDLKDTQFPGVTCETLGPGVQKCVNPESTIAGTSAHLVVYYLDGRLVVIWYKQIDKKQKAKIDDALTIKYGQPFKSRDQRGVYWEDGTVQLSSKTESPKYFEINIVDSDFYNTQVVANRIKGIDPSKMDL